MPDCDDYDSPWKDILTLHFRQFMLFFFPDLAPKIDWDRGYDSLDKELRQITSEAETGGRRLADKLFKVWKKNGEEAWVLAHVEVQAQRKKDFPRRMFVYNYRIYDLYERPVVSLAVLADESPEWRPCVYSHKFGVPGWPSASEWSNCLITKGILISLRNRTMCLPWSWSLICERWRQKRIAGNAFTTRSN